MSQLMPMQPNCDEFAPNGFVSHRRAQQVQQLIQFRSRPSLPGAVCKMPAQQSGLNGPVRARPTQLIRLQLSYKREQLQAEVPMVTSATSSLRTLTSRPVVVSRAEAPVLLLLNSRGVVRAPARARRARQLDEEVEARLRAFAAERWPHRGAEHIAVMESISLDPLIRPHTVTIRCEVSPDTFVLLQIDAAAEKVSRDDILQAEACRAHVVHVAV